jgi:hypothetical protein
VGTGADIEVAKLSATFDGQGNVAIAVPEEAIEYRGRIVMRSDGVAQLILVQTGGVDNGKTWMLTFRSDF